MSMTYNPDFPIHTLGPYTPPQVGCDVMESYTSAWGVSDIDYGDHAYSHDPTYHHEPLYRQDLSRPDGMQDQLSEKSTIINPPVPLHRYMIPLSLQPLQPESPVRPMVYNHVDMRMARPGTDEAKAGCHTPLASYTAQTFWYFWHADVFASFPQAQEQQSNGISLPTHRPFDNEGRPQHPIHPNQLQPTAAFSQFVVMVLHNTQVSFSVTILALMYTYKYKKIMATRPPAGTMISESQGFVTALMLANKYLDDNTYTSSTWATILGLPVVAVNTQELEWLDALEFSLCVRTDEFETWRSMLDAHIRCRERAEYHRLITCHETQYAPLQLNYSVSPSIRAHSASPPLSYFSPALLPPAPEHTVRKRSARDAFSADTLHHSGMDERARLASRIASFMPNMPLPSIVGSAVLQPVESLPLSVPTSNMVFSSPGGGLARSSSLSRQIARLPSARRGSAGNVQVGPSQPDLRHTAAANNAVAQRWVFPTGGRGTSQGPLDQRYLKPNADVQRLYFLQAAATPQFGPDSGFRKAIPHYQDHPSVVSQISMVSAPQTEHVDSSTLLPKDVIAMPPPMAFLPMQQGAYGNYEPQPAAFANAGPPGYEYGYPSTTSRKPGHAYRWSTSSDEGLGLTRPTPLLSACSEWSSPVHHGRGF